MEHCIINGKRCSKCCEVLTINLSKNLMECMAYARRHGSDKLTNHAESERQIYTMIKQVSKRRAKKINKRLVGLVKNKQAYFTCKHLTSSGCGNYQNRPAICSGYPYYGLSKSEFKQKYVTENDSESSAGLYSENCTYYVELK